MERGLPSLADRPWLLLWGMRDWCFHEWYLQRFLNFISTAEVHRLPDAGHWLVEDAPADVIERIDQFISQTASNRIAESRPLTTDH
jgi:haloalkane dehalogenase